MDYILVKQLSNGCEIGKIAFSIENRRNPNSRARVSAIRCAYNKYYYYYAGTCVVCALCALYRYI